ncbi:hypothetical protein LTR66_000632 [Elasticomyces elasticus]|nr:hypothetical protein LTR66_000632 [Elasticomyces elasticus]
MPSLAILTKPSLPLAIRVFSALPPEITDIIYRHVAAFGPLIVMENHTDGTCRLKRKGYADRSQQDQTPEQCYGQPKDLMALLLLNRTSYEQLTTLIPLLPSTVHLYHAYFDRTHCYDPFFPSTLPSPKNLHLRIELPSYADRDPRIP